MEEIWKYAIQTSAKCKEMQYQKGKNMDKYAKKKLEYAMYINYKQLLVYTNYANMHILHICKYPYARI